MDMSGGEAKLWTFSHLAISSMAYWRQHTAGATTSCLVLIVAMRGEQKLKTGIQSCAAISSNLVNTIQHYLACQT